MPAVAPRGDRSDTRSRRLRRAVLTLSLVALVVLAGCSGDAQSTPVTASGSSIAFADEAAAEAGYDRVEAVERRINATLRAELEGDVSVTEVVDVRATIPIVRYRRSTPDGPAVLAVASSPSVQLVENPPVTRDPLSTLSPTELARFVQSTYPLDVVSEGTETDATVAGNRTDVVTYEARLNRSALARTAESTPPAPDGAPLTVRVVRTDRSDDVVTIVSVTPRGRDANLDALLDALLSDS